MVRIKGPFKIDIVTAIARLPELGVEVEATRAGLLAALSRTEDC